MNIIVVDDERAPLEDLEQVLKNVCPDATIRGFSSPKSALEHACSNRVDLAFLDIEMAGMNGLQLAKGLKDIYGKVNIIFTTGHPQYALDAYEIHACGYLLKPVSKDAVIESMDYLHHPVGITEQKKIRVQTFGNFEVYADGKPVMFSRSKTRELLAYLVMRKGSQCSNNEIVAALWENKPDSAALQNQYRHLVMDLKKTLKSISSEDILLKKRGSLAILPEKITCDLYDFYAGDIVAVNSYSGEFMAQYSWAEFYNAHLIRFPKGN